MSELPRVTARQRLGETELCLTLAIDPEAMVFEGHFPGRPILPGVAQIDWAARLAARHLNCTGTFSGMEQIKFHRMIQPPARVRLNLEWQPGRGRLMFDYRDSADTDCLYSRGCLHFTD